MDTAPGGESRTAARRAHSPIPDPRRPDDPSVPGTGDPDARGRLIGRQLERVESQLQHTRNAVAALHRLLDPAATLEVDGMNSAVGASPGRHAVLSAMRIRRVMVVDSTKAEMNATVVRQMHIALKSRGAGREVELVVERRNTTSTIAPKYGQVRTGPPGGLYDNDLFTDGRGRLVVYGPVAEPARSGRVEPLMIPSTELAVTVHCGAISTST